MDISAPDRYDAANRAFEAIERCAHPTAATTRAIADDALRWAGLGFADRARKLVRRWRSQGVGDSGLDEAELIFHVTIEPSSAAALLKARGADAPQVAALDVVNRLYRGDLTAAVQRAEEHDWFLADAELAHGMFHAVWALGLLDELDRAQEVVELWRAHHRVASPAQLSLILRAEAAVASFQQRYTVEESMTAEALAIARQHDIDVSISYAEASMVAAHARAGSFEAAERLSHTWPRIDGPARGPIEAYWERARLDVALALSRYDEAAACARRALAFFAQTDHAPMICQLLFCIALTAGEKDYPQALEAYRRSVRRCPMSRYARRLALMEELVAAGYPSARSIVLGERSRFDTQSTTALRIWVPPVTAIGADLFWNKTLGTLHLGGRGPFSLAKHPTLRKTLEAILEQPSFSISIPALFENVWEQPYNPLVHEGKVHVTLHRLRSRLRDWRGGDGAVIVVDEGCVRIADAMAVRVLELPRHVEAERHTLAGRVLECIESSPKPIPPREIASRLGISRSGLHRALRQLVAEGRVERTGLGRATRYCASK